MIDLNKLQAEIHENAKAKGWHDLPKSWPDVRMAIVSELSEAWEEYRSGRMTVYWSDGQGRTPDPTEKPEGFGVELGDAWIRCADENEKRGWRLSDEDAAIALTPAEIPADVVTVSEQLDWLCRVLHTYGPWRQFTSACLAVAEMNRVDLWTCVRLKMDYNRGRSYRHGGKAA